MRTELIVLLISALCSSVNSHLFHFIPDTMNWTDAQTHCRQHYVDLATVNDQKDLNELLKTLPKGFRNYVWIGLYRTEANDSWVFSDQSGSLFRQWLPGQPNNLNGIQFCAYMTPSGSWNDWQCSDKLAFICYTEKKRCTMRLEVKSHLNVNDPGVSDGILTQLEQILKMKGLPGDVKLSWTTFTGGNVFQMWYQKNEYSNTPCKRETN